MQQREHWGSHLGFVLATAGSAIGLGTLWKFPYMTGENGGGLFFLIYIFCVFFIGIPLFIAELILGRNTQRAAVGVFATLVPAQPFWKGIGWLGVVSSFIIMSYYSVIAGWGLNYVFMSLNQFYQDRSADEIHQIFDLVAKSADITLFWHFVFTALTVVVVYRGVRQGIEYWSKIMMSALLIMLLGLLALTVTMSGFPEATSFLFSPNWSNFKASSALEALGLAFFNLSLGQGIMLTYGSYMRRSDDIPRTAMVVGLMIVAVSVLAGLTIFPIIFTFGFAPAAGPGLAFKILPVLFAKLPGALLISTGFFTLLVFAALTSSVAFVEVVAANFMDLLGWSRRRSVLVVGAACFLFGIPSALATSSGVFNNWHAIYGKNFFDTMDALVTIWLLPIGGLLTSLFAGWVVSKQMSKEEFRLGSSMQFLWSTWLFFVRFVVPLAIALIILQKGGLIDIDQFFNNKSDFATVTNR